MRRLFVYSAMLLLQLTSSGITLAQHCPGQTKNPYPNDRSPIPFPDTSKLDSIIIQYDDGSIKLSISGAGLVQFDGEYRVAVEGHHERQITGEEVQQLLQEFRKADFYSLCDDYSVNATDVGWTNTSIQIGGSRKVITDDWVEVPQVLQDVQAAILKYSHSAQWTKGNPDTVPGLLRENPDSTSRESVLSDVLPRAALYGDVSTIRAILANKVELDRHGPYASTALMLAADRGLPEMVSALLRAGANPQAVDEVGRNALIFGAGSGNSEVVRLLLAAGLKPDQADMYGDTALMAAAAAGNPESVQLLLKDGANVNARNDRRQTALLSGSTGDSGFGILEADRMHTEIPDELVHRDQVVKLLIEAGADIEVHGWFGDTALFSLEPDAIRELIRHHANLESRNEYGETALIATVSEVIAKLLIDAGANVNAKDEDGKTALIQAAENNYLDKLEVLLKVPGIRLDLRDKKDETALMKAKAKNLDDAVRILVEAGASE